MRKYIIIMAVVISPWLMSMTLMAQTPGPEGDPAAEKIQAIADAEEDFVEGPEPDAIFRIPVEPMAERNETNAMTTSTLAPWRGHVLMVVNVASKCGLTPQYKQLEALYQKYRDQGFVVLGFPSNDFMGQEPGTEAEILAFCSNTYDVTFPLYAKLHAKGDSISPLYKFLTAETSGFPGEIAWNFTKFIIGRDGRIVGRFEPKTTPDAPEVIELIETELAKPAPPDPTAGKAAADTEGAAAE